MPQNLTETVTKRIEAAQAAQGVSTRQLADMTFIPRVTLERRIMCGTLTLSDIEDIAAALHASVWDLLGAP